MPDDDIKQIKPDTSPAQEQKESAGQDPLIPKINPKTTEPLEEEVAEEEKAETVMQAAPESKKRRINFSGFLKNKRTKWAAGILLLLLLLILIPSVLVYTKAKSFYKEAQELQVAAQSQDLVQMRTQLAETKGSLSSLQSTYKLITWTKFIPFLGGYTRDGAHALNAASHGFEAGEILLDTIEPYADLLGLNGASEEVAGSGEKTTQERIDFIVKTLPDLVPKMDNLSSKMVAVNAEISEINPSRYPEKFRGQPVREQIRKGVELVGTASRLVANSRPLIEQSEYLLGVDGTRVYLVLFQNDKELRPTGGFMTAYSIMDVEDARFEPVSSNDIYNLDAQYNPHEPAPDPIVEYIKGPYIIDQSIRLRDMNWSPDFKESMEGFAEEIEDLGIDEIDGIIAVDTQLLVYLLDAIGPIGVPGFGNFSTEIIPECNCPQVIYELESFADIEGPIVWDPVSGEIVYSPPNTDNRKKIIGPLMNSIMANALGQPKEKLPELFEAAFKSVIEKHVLFYLLDEDAQAAVEAFGVAGRMDEFAGDYLHINDANLGGRKSNLYVTQEVEQDIEIAGDGTVTKTVTITYKNPEKHDGWLNSVLPNWVRVYVPQGSNLIDVSGLEEKEEPYEEFGKTVFAGYFELRPEGVAKVTLTYTLPQKFDDNYSLFIQKQPGKHMPLYIMNVDEALDEFFLKTDKELNFRI